MRESFTQRELDVLGLIADGLTNQEVAQKLHVSPETVKWYAKQLYLKLGVNNRTQASTRAADLGLLDPPGNRSSNDDPIQQVGNLPAQLASYVGRRRDVALIKELVAEHRLVTLTGTGGIGKTRLALQVAEQLQGTVRDGVWLVELAQVSDPAQVLHAVGRVLAITETLDAPIDVVLKGYLRTKKMLFVLDNFEHLLDSAPLVGDLLTHAPELNLLVTSRERIQVYGEMEVPVSPLTVPESRYAGNVQDLRGFDAVALFIDRARAVRPDYQFDDVQVHAVGQICARLDGLPLAIELAAPLVKLFPPTIIVERLQGSLDLLPDGPRDFPDRQRTLRATLDWSYGLLAVNEQVLLTNLTAFRGGSTLDAIEFVCVQHDGLNVINTLTSLVDRSLVISEEGSDGEIHFSLLETTYQFMRERLIASDQLDIISLRHAEYFARLAERAMAEYSSPNHTAWFARIRDEQENLRAAFTWSLDHDQAAISLRLAGALREYWRNYLLQREGLSWATAALNQTGDDLPAERAQVLLAAGSYAIDLDQIEDAAHYLDGAVEHFKQVGDPINVARCRALQGFLDAESQVGIGRGIAVAQKSMNVMQEAHDLGGMIEVCNILGELAKIGQDYDMAEQYYRDCLSMAEENGERLRMAMQYTNLGTLAYLQARYELAAALTKQGLAIFLEMDVLIAVCYDIAGLAGAALGSGDPERAARLLGAANAGLGNLEISFQQADRRVVSQVLMRTRSVLDESRFRSAWQEGQRLTLQEAFDYALAD